MGGVATADEGSTPRMAVMLLTLVSPVLLSTVPLQETYVEDFDLLWSAVERRYAYLERPGVDWHAAREWHRPRAAAVDGPDEALSIFEDLLEGLRDHHVHLNLNNKRSPRLVPSHTDLWLEWAHGEALVTSVRRGSDAARAGIVPGDVVVEVRDHPIAEAAAKRLGLSSPNALARLDAETIGWALRVELVGSWNEPRTLLIDGGGDADVSEITLGNRWAPRYDGLLHAETTEVGVEAEQAIGYIRLHDALGRTETIAAFDSAIEELRETHALIVDLRETAGGGNTTVARAILGHFVSTPRPYQRHVLVEETRTTGVARSWLEEVSPRGKSPYEGRVLVLVGRWTGSMGEGLAMGFDTLGADVVGEPMAGLLGALTEVTLPNTGWTVRFAHEALTHVDGTPRELWRPPNFARDPSPGDERDDVLLAALELAKTAPASEAVREDAVHRR